ncbi:MAG: type III-B CRISPR-associated protein Cas10/Cmr2 [Arthrospira sp. PLM2.Bin9]|nr:type III-B CRISPR-associated protein Cas10/Cmr2 [Arthrospira sp. PLM2.Bin9]TVU54225.1 MAG: type III-B CRISPR-associated protein Cas10/Cmr2 [Arthrospira sp. PLM2.Bin9]
MSIFHRKIYALLGNSDLCNHLVCLQTEEGQTALSWWLTHQGEIEAIASSSDRINLEIDRIRDSPTIIKHPISGQARLIEPPNHITIAIPDWLKNEPDPQTVFWWLWRFEPELQRQQYPDALLYPQHSILPDCPVHSYRATVSALASTIEAQNPSNEYPHLLLFTFSPIQDFIKASRKFLDFWSGSYLLHYLSAKLCWFVAENYGADIVITPSLWGQEIIDAFLLKKYPAFSETFKLIDIDGYDPLERYNLNLSTSLATAGFPNTIAMLFNSAATAKEVGNTLCQKLRQEWINIADNVREGITNHPIKQLEIGLRDRIIEFLKNPANQDTIEQILKEFAAEGSDRESHEHDLEKWQKKSCWEWRNLWENQINNTWQTYWTAVPLGDPNTPLIIDKNNQEEFDDNWIQSQQELAGNHEKNAPPTVAETIIYRSLNNGTWWGSIQARCAQAMQGIKNTRTWSIPVSPGLRSSLSGQLSALHPQFRYHGNFREGYGLPVESMRLFWRLIAKVYPGLFNGSEMLNAIEMTKRMAWVYGGVGESLGINFRDLENENDAEIDYSEFIRFPNLSCIAYARFAYEDWQLHSNQGKLTQYWRYLQHQIQQDFGKSSKEYQRFLALSRGRLTNIPKTDSCINPNYLGGKNYNGIMFSSKWLADDMGLNSDEIRRLRPLVEAAHIQTKFGDGSPSDWWVIVLGDGDGMGKYVSGKKLHPYQQYLTETEPHGFMQREGYLHLNDEEYNRKLEQFIRAFRDDDEALLATRKRMGPATHIGLNRALLDFSNRLVPLITEKRFCGKVVYSGGDDVMALLPLEDLPDYLLSLRAAWCGAEDPYKPQLGEADLRFESRGGYWMPISQNHDFQGLPNRPLFTMGENATMSFGIVIAHKSVPLPIALSGLWEAEKQAKKMLGTPGIKPDEPGYIPPKSGLCFRVMYSSGNCLEALLKGELLESWRQWINTDQPQILSSLLYRLAEELPLHASLTPNSNLIAKAAWAISQRREEVEAIETNRDGLIRWLEDWENWAGYLKAQWQENSQLDNQGELPLGIDLKSLSYLLRFSAFWLDKMQQRQEWQGRKEDI